MHEPYTYLNGLSITDLEDLLDASPTALVDAAAPQLASLHGPLQADAARVAAARVRHAAGCYRRQSHCQRHRRWSGGTDFIANQILAASSPLTESPVISLLSQANCTYAQHRQAKRHQGNAAHGWHLRDITRVG